MIFKILLGLNKNLDEVRGRVLSTKPLASMVYSKVRREESWKKVMMDTQVEAQDFTTSPYASALYAHRPNLNSYGIQSRKNGPPWCDH